ncbi:YggS family pyridoxal phosphate-dependent enzyme [Lampropedia puyangensis]|uniref:Pyridoxal phosphate homeostasis protein n=1 Tax=Lampropedia puyangensis TaxID=1330072 RepID=A0A4S8F5U8_9BURK|nr:YggS family pyridoxal phosphate-dependent enzyme [Lampropedia puyangensis]THU00672.1 YggS family pyridoxal phosphate-dependent enzyme [Lampropedia puyangensis]
MSERYQPALLLEDIQHNLAAIHARMQAACARAGRSAQEVRLLPVTKTVEVDRLRTAYAAGVRQMGENKVQEAHGKWQAMGDLTDLQWCVIGHLQTNKAKVVAEFASEFHALDSLRVAEALDKRLQVLGRSLKVMVQVNTSGEESKFGLEPAQAVAFVKQLPAFSSLQVCGLMTLAINTSEESRVRACFRVLRALRDQVQQETTYAGALRELSMGMSGDFEWAIEEGATTVRVGQAIFGARALPDSHYWPAQ